MSALMSTRILVKLVIKFLIGILCAPMAWRRASPSELRVLYYHRINDLPRASLGPVSRELSVHPANFRRQLAYMERRGYSVISAEEFRAFLENGNPLPPRPVLITFDDGYADNHTHAWPLLQEFGAHAIIFLPTDYMGSETSFAWDPGTPAPGSAPLSWTQVRAMGQGGVTFGSHSKSHRRLDALHGADLDAELTESKARIERETGHPVCFFAYPGGHFTPGVARAVQRAGYGAAFTTVPGVVRGADDPFTLRRIEVSASDPMPVFAMKLSGALDVLAIKESALAERIRARVNQWFLSRLKHP